MFEIQEPINRQPATGKRILIVGAGPAGMLLALECKRLGWEPIVLEKEESVQMAGDVIVIGPSAVKVFRHWPRLRGEYDQKSHHCKGVYHKHNGEHILGPFTLKEGIGKPMLRQNLQRILGDAVKRQDILVKFNHKVDSYFETMSEAGVVLANGQRLTADIVAACDGVHSRSWKVIKSAARKAPINSGHAVYRTSLPMRELFEADPELEQKFGCKDGQPYLSWYSGPDTHALVFADGETICWSVHHPANANTSTESWSATLDGKTVEEQLLKQQSDWDPALLSMVRNTPGQTINDWLLMFRDPDPNWVSPKGRVVQCGDSAHPFLPTSANGVVQAMEDAVTLAAALRLGIDHSGSIKESVQVFNQIRFPRTSCAQLMGMVHRQSHHKIDWDMIAENPKKLAEIGPGKWVGRHDPEIYIKENFEACLESVRHNTSFEPTNTPPGYKVRSWNCEEIFEREKAHELLQLEGDWH